MLYLNVLSLRNLSANVSITLKDVAFVTIESASLSMIIISNLSSIIRAIIRLFTETATLSQHSL